MTRSRWEGNWSSGEVQVRAMTAGAGGLQEQLRGRRSADLIKLWDRAWALGSTHSDGDSPSLALSRRLGLPMQSRGRWIESIRLRFKPSRWGFNGASGWGWSLYFPMRLPRPSRSAFLWDVFLPRSKMRPDASPTRDLERNSRDADRWLVPRSRWLCSIGQVVNKHKC
jgi:hypothetical protein